MIIIKIFFRRGAGEIASNLSCKIIYHKKCLSGFRMGSNCNVNLFGETCLEI